MARSNSSSGKVKNFFRASIFLTFKEFVKLSEDEQSTWRPRILDLEKDWLDAELAKRNAEWILVIGGKVVRWSSSLEKLPKKMRHTALQNPEAWLHLFL
ncbi:MAG: hypothetical protein ONB46_25750 [candidate division KSB1 bacterium]|nr:hypothetical protein [candidate division KSB1 bacterium]MDZ7369337.1 hypothetical protein [candidate division KSB1 bacterium]MDZ7407361.1 hypothetical protein [candidate division KSB1 bacterium]